MYRRYIIHCIQCSSKYTGRLDTAVSGCGDVCFNNKNGENKKASQENHVRRKNSYLPDTVSTRFIFCSVRFLASAVPAT